jgi:hypothetical protein
MTLTRKCPFTIGDFVIYRPTSRGRGLVVMTNLSASKPGDKYKIVRIDKGDYVVPEGLENATPGGVIVDRILQHLKKERFSPA